MQNPNRSAADAAASSDEILGWWVYQVLLPTAMALMALCFILGAILIVKSYIMTRLRTNILREMGRRRQSGPAPSNNYVDANEVRSSRIQQVDNNSRISIISSAGGLTTHERSLQRQSELSGWVTVN